MHLAHNGLEADEGLILTIRNLHSQVESLESLIENGTS